MRARTMTHQNRIVRSRQARRAEAIYAHAEQAAYRRYHGLDPVTGEPKEQR